jgi:hypothetical protein
LSSLILLMAVMNLCLEGPFEIGIAFLSKVRYGSSVKFGLLLSCVAAGGLAGLLLAGSWRPKRRGALIIITSGVIGVCTIATGLFTDFIPVAVLLFVINVIAGVFTIHLTAWFQQRVPTDMFGRAMSVVIFSTTCLAPVSFALAGIAMKINITAMFVTSGILICLATGFAASQRSIREIL